MRKISVFVILITFLLSEDAQVVNGYKYYPPQGFKFLTSFPSDIMDYGKQTLVKDKLGEWLIVSALTGIFIVYDEPLIVEAKKIGRKFNIAEDDKTTEFFRIFDQPIRFPTDVGSAMYFIGDGWTHLGIAGSFYTYGRLSKNNRAMQTGSQIAQAMASAGFLTQVLKHLTGRVSPFKSEPTIEIHNGEEYERPNDKWTLFPNQIEYHKHVSSYDAFPSGHMAVCMATFTVIAENYPESKIVWPIGITAMSLLGFQMMNNGVHWISDYPLAISMGYYLGKIAVNSGRQRVENKAYESSLKITPIINTDLSTGISLQYRF